MRSIICLFTLSFCLWVQAKVPELCEKLVIEAEIISYMHMQFSSSDTIDKVDSDVLALNKILPKVWAQQSAIEALDEQNPQRTLLVEQLEAYCEAKLGEVNLGTPLPKNMKPLPESCWQTIAHMDKMAQSDENQDELQSLPQEQLKAVRAYFGGLIVALWAEQHELCRVSDCSVRLKGIEQQFCRDQLMYLF